MTPQSAEFLEKANKLIVEAGTMLSVSLNDAAGRNAYLAAFHAAQAVIFEQTGKAPKSHNGVQTEFLKLTKDDVRIAPELRLFLSRAYNLKSIADYETGPGSEISTERARDAVATCQRFLQQINSLIEATA